VIASVIAQGLTVAEEAPEAGAMAGAEGGAMAGVEGGAMAGAMGGSPEAGTEPMWDSELIHIGEVVSFSAEVTDPDLEEGCDLNARLDYHWSVVRSPAQSSATLNRADARSPSLTTDAAGEYTVRLVVTDAEGHPSAPVEVDFVVEGCGGNAPTGELSFAPEAPQAGDLIALSASFSDPDEGCVEGALSYQWRFTSLPAGSVAMLNDPTAITPSFVADVPGDYSLAAVVTDETGRMSEAHLTLSASECGAYEPTIEQVSHEPELLNAGQAVRFNAVVTDRDLEPACGRVEQLSYQWRLSESPAASAATLSLAQTPSAALITDVAGEYEVSLVVTDARGFESAPVSHRVTVGSCGLSAPTLSLEASALAPATGEVIAFNAVVSDADNSAPCDEGQSFNYQWAVLEAPAGSASALLNPQAKTPSLNVDVEGVYLIGCVVTDSTGRASSQATLALNVNACGTNAPEVVNVSAEASPRVGLPARLEVVASDSDNDVTCGLAQALTYRWRMLSTPVGSAAQLLNASLSVASFVPDVVGEYEAEVTVTDETGRAASSAVSLTVGECGVRAPVIDALSLNSPDLRVGTPVEASVSVSDADEDDVACGLEQDLTVMWEVVSAPVGSQAALDDATRLVTSFTPDLPGDYTLRVRASDNIGMMSAWQSTQVSINDCGLARPVINSVSESAGPYLIGEAVRFSADFNDADLDAACLPSQTHTHHWRLISAPAGAEPSLVGLSNPTLDLTPDLPGEYIVGLMMSDDTGLTSREVTRSVVVDQCGGFAPELTTITSDSLTPEWALNVPVRLSSDAVDPDVRDCGLEGELSYMWALRASPVGSQARLNDAQLSAPSLTPDMPGEYELSLVVTDARGQASALRASFTAADCGLNTPVAVISATSPIISNVSPLAVTVGDVVQFDGRDSSDADEACGVATTLSYHWLLLRVPPASEATLSLPNGLTPWLRADAPGLYRVQLIVSDGEHMSAPVTFEVNAN
jgi:PKD repeat protein